MNDLTAIRNLGLSEPEANAYLALLKLGGSRPSQVAKEMGIKRTTVYPILKTLAKKGFAVVYFRQNSRFYYAQKPKKVTALAQKKIERFNDIIPQLNALERTNVQTIGLRYIETREELEEFYRGILAEYKNREYQIISSAQGWEGIDPEFFIQYRKDRGKNNIKTRLLLSADSKGINPTDPKLKREYKYLGKEYKFKSTIDIYDDKILVVSPDLKALAVVIEIPPMIDVFKSIFEALWNVTPALKN